MAQTLSYFIVFCLGIIFPFLFVGFIASLNERHARKPETKPKEKKPTTGKLRVIAKSEEREAEIEAEREAKKGWD